MALSYRPVDWNRQKRIYDLTLLALLGSGLAVFFAVSLWVSPNITAETLVIRGCSISAFLLLHLLLCIGPLSRLDRRFLPLLYNRRHLGVTIFGLGLIHAVFSTFQFHALGNENPLVSLWTAYQGDYVVRAGGRLSIAHFPFEPFGVVALMILTVMAVTSHDFWLRHLGAVFWKTLHLGVYAAYGLLVGHVGLGILQDERHWIYPSLLSLGFCVVTGLHLAAAWTESQRDRQKIELQVEGFSDAGPIEGIPESRARMLVVAGERVAVWRHRDLFHATSNVCRHQGGPVGEGRIVDGCITCPWHGWTYRPEDGCSPPPFQERLATHAVRVVDGHVWVAVQPRAGVRSVDQPQQEGQRA